jgi:glycosyltransferase involved in cell wall biosynthesis
MRIVYLHQYFATREMPEITRSFEMATRWAAAGHEVHVVTTERRGRLPKGGSWVMEQIEGVHIHWLPVPYSNHMTYGERMRAFLRYAVAAGRRAHQIGGDIVFATSTPLTVAIPAVYAAKRLGVPMVFEVRDLWPDAPIALGVLRNPLSIWMARRLERFAYRNSEHVIALSPGMAEGVERAGYPGDRITVVPNACDRDLFACAGPSPELLERVPELCAGPLLVYAGTAGLVNGLGYLVDLAAAMLTIDPDIRFAVIGDGRELEELRERATAKGVLERNLWFISPVPKAEMPGVLATATVASSFVIDVPALWQNSANKFFDGLAAGKPMVINYGGWQADLLQETGAGLVLPPGDPIAGAASLREFLRDSARLQVASEQAVRIARERFDRDDLSNRALRVLEDAVAIRTHAS